MLSIMFLISVFLLPCISMVLPSPSYFVLGFYRIGYIVAIMFGLYPNVARSSSVSEAIRVTMGDNKCIQQLPSKRQTA